MLCIKAARLFIAAVKTVCARSLSRGRNSSAVVSCKRLRFSGSLRRLRFVADLVEERKRLLLNPVIGLRRLAQRWSRGRVAATLGQACGRVQRQREQSGGERACEFHKRVS
jgi:hypothetical protein